MKKLKLNIQMFSTPYTYFEFEDYPSTNTPLNATNLNNMQDTIHTETNDTIENFIKVVPFSFTIEPIPANNTVFDQVTTIPTSTLSNDYTPIGIVGESKRGGYYANCCFTRLYVDGRDVKWSMVNTANATTGSLTITLYILAVKNNNE